MSDFVIGIPIGIAMGIFIGIAIGKKQKPWSEMTYEEKRNRKILIGVLSITAILGLIVFLLLVDFLYNLLVL